MEVLGEQQQVLVQEQQLLVRVLVRPLVRVRVRVRVRVQQL